MNDLGFINGSEVRVKINGQVVGGVLSAVCKTDNNLIKIEEFLTEKPVCSALSPGYTIELKTHRSPDELFSGGAPETISFEAPDRLTEYSGCAVEKTESRLLPRGIIEYSVVLSASDRSVEK